MGNSQNRAAPTGRSRQELVEAAHPTRVHMASVTHRPLPSGCVYPEAKKFPSVQDTQAGIHPNPGEPMSQQGPPDSPPSTE